MSAESPAGREARSSHSQTLSRGVRVLEILAEAHDPLTIAEVAEALGVHRSVAYRILRTLEDHRLVDRDLAGRMRLAPRVAALARGVSRDLQTVALPELSALANDLGVTALIALYDRDEVITLVSVEPRHTRTAVTQRPGTRHPIDRGGPGLAIRMQLDDDALAALPPVADERALEQARRNGYSTSRDEVIPGLAAVAVPLVLPDDPSLATLAAIYIDVRHDIEELAERLHATATAVTDALR